MENSYKKLLAVIVLLLLMIAAVVVVYPARTVNAQSDESQKAPMPAVVPIDGPAVVGISHVLKHTYINTCLPGCTTFAVGAGKAVPLDAATTINCPAAIGATCTITDDAWVELQNTSSTTNNPQALGFYVDGVDADYLYDGGGGTPGGANFDAIAHKTAVATKVSPGSHTVRTYTYSVYGSNGSGWTATYRVYVP